MCNVIFKMEAKNVKNFITRKGSRGGLASYARFWLLGRAKMIPNQTFQRELK